MDISSRAHASYGELSSQVAVDGQVILRGDRVREREIGRCALSISPIRSRYDCSSDQSVSESFAVNNNVFHYPSHMREVRYGTVEASSDSLLSLSTCLVHRLASDQKKKFHTQFPLSLSPRCFCLPFVVNYSRILVSTFVSEPCSPLSLSLLNPFCVREPKSSSSLSSSPYLPQP
jgi:hypothetical protein